MEDIYIKHGYHTYYYTGHLTLHSHHQNFQMLSYCKKSTMPTALYKTPVGTTGAGRCCPPMRELSWDAFSSVRNGLWAECFFLFSEKSGSLSPIPILKYSFAFALPDLASVSHSKLSKSRIVIAVNCEAGRSRGSFAGKSNGIFVRVWVQNKRK